tara:strand:+ start:18 stop:464 length:447 start_codon:yes stop_codon:yes gene_type:complete
MGWQMAVVGALGAAQIQQQGAYGKFNQAKANRDALVKEQNAEILDNKLTLDLSTFNKKFKELEGSVIVNAAKSGVTQGGTTARIKLANLTNAELERDKMRYDTEIGKARAFEEANFARISGQISRQEAKIAQLRTLTSTGTSLLQMKG